MLGNTEGKKRRGRQRMRWLDSITNSVDMNFSELQKIVKDRETWCAIVHCISKSWTQLSNWTMTTKCKTSVLLCSPFFMALVVQWFNAGGPGSIPGPDTRSHMLQKKIKGSVYCNWDPMHSNKSFFLNVKLLLLCGRQSRGRGKLQSWRKYLQTIYPTKDYFLEYKDSQNSTVKAKQNPKPPNNPIRKWAENRNRHLTEEDLQISHKHAERYWTSLAIKEMQIKTTVRDVRGSPVVKNLPFNAEDMGSIPGVGRFHRLQGT